MTMMAEEERGSLAVHASTPTAMTAFDAPTTFIRPIRSISNLPNAFTVVTMTTPMAMETGLKRYDDGDKSRDLGGIGWYEMEREAGRCVISVGRRWRRPLAHTIRCLELRLALHSLGALDNSSMLPRPRFRYDSSTVDELDDIEQTFTRTDDFEDLPRTTG